MDLLPTDEQQEITATSAAFLAAHLPIAALRSRRDEPSPIDWQVWRRCAGLGWLGLGLPEVHGGVGYGLTEESLLFRQMGRHLAPGPFLATSLAARVAAACGAEELVGGMLAGDVVVGLAQPRSPDAGVGPVVSGSFDLFDATDAAYLLAVDPGGAALVAASDVDGRGLRCIDPGVRLGRADIDRATAVGWLPSSAEDLFGRGGVLAAAMLTGISEAVRDMAAEYARVRVQFGKPIGVHQAIKHRCAEMALRTEAASSQLVFAALSVDSRRPDAAFQVAAAKVVAANAAIDNASENIQLHGGTGYTYGHDAHLYLERAHVIDQQLGTVRAQLGRLMSLPAAQ